MTADPAPLSAAAPDAPRVPWRAIFAGLCATLVSVGLARFAYTPLLPAMIDARWFDVADVVYLGAANLVGYFVGALAARPLARRVANRDLLRAMLVVVTLAFAACAFPLSVAWFFVWRLLSGLAGGIVMVLVAATVLPHIPPARRGLAGGAVFVGVGLGIAASGSLVPAMLEVGLRATWLGMATLAAVLVGASWRCWPRARAHEGAPRPAAGAVSPTRALAVFYLQFGLMAVALVPMMVFLSDYIARGLGRGAHSGGHYWLLYGLGAIAGPMLYGWLGDRLGARVALRAVWIAQALLSLALMATDDTLALAVIAVLAGTYPPGMVSLVLARIRELLPAHPARQDAAYSHGTSAFALAQAGSAYAYSYLFTASGGSYLALFVVAAAALVTAVLIDLAMPRTAKATA